MNSAVQKEFVCIVCPNSCRLTVTEEDGALRVAGNECKRGVDHGVREYTRPERMLTTTVAVAGGTLSRLPVISSGEVPRAMLRECLEHLYAITVKAPVSFGQVIAADILGTGVDIVASRSMETK